MAYIIGQYNKSSSTNSMTPLSGGTVSRISAEAEGGTGFTEESVIFPALFVNDTTY